MLTRLQLRNFKSWQDTGSIALKPITGFFGVNSSGKSSLIQALLLMKQTVDSSDRRVVFHFGDDRTLVNLGDFESVIHAHDTKRILGLSLGWNTKEEFVIPGAYAGGTVAQGENIEFEVRARANHIGLGHSLILEEMAYSVAGRRFEVRRRQTGHVDYDMFVSGSDVAISRRSTDADRFIPSRFHVFPYWITRNSEEDRRFFFDLEYEVQLLLDDVYYLGPLRAYPNRIYFWSGAQPVGMGPAGDLLVDAILSSHSHAPVQLEQASVRRNLTIEQYVAECLRYLGLVHDFSVAAVSEGKRIFEIKLRKSPEFPEVVLPDIGFGVSQILPVLAMCFYASQDFTIILEQPDIHLHPAAQAGLADIFVDAWKQRGVQTLFESHSEHLLRRLQRRIAEGEIQKDDVGLFFCSTDDSGASQLSHLQLDQFGNISNWPKDFFGDQFGEIAFMSEAVLKRQEHSE